MAKLDTLVDDFSTFNTSDPPWENSYGTPTLNNGQIELSCVSAYEGIYTGSTYDATDSYFIVEMVSQPTGGNDTRDTGLQLEDTTNSIKVEMRQFGGTVYCREQVSGTPTTLESFVYNATDHRWWRLSIDTVGTDDVYSFWTSPDGTSWTQQGSGHTANASIDLTAVFAQVFCGYFGTESSPPDAVIDNVNNPPPVANANAGTGATAGTANNATINEAATSDSKNPILGTYGGYGSTGVTNVNANETRLGRSVELASDYLPHDAWSWFNESQMRDQQLDGWRDWRDNRPGSLLAYGIPLLTDDNVGDFTGVVNGDYDVHFQKAADALISSGHADAIVRIGWEPNNANIGSWEATSNPSGYINAFQHVVTLFRNTSGQDFTFELSSAIGPSGSITDFSDYYPGDAYVDYIGMNFYDVWWGASGEGATAEERWDHIRTTNMGMDDHIAFVNTRGKENICSEWGLYEDNGDNFNGGGDNPYFITQMADYFRSESLYYQCYFDWDWGGGVLSDFPNGEAEYVVQFDTAPHTSALPVAYNATTLSGIPSGTSTVSNSTNQPVSGIGSITIPV